MRRVLMLLLAGLVSGTALGNDATIKVRLHSQNNSGQTGTATLTPRGERTKVVIELSNVPAGVAQPAHIHRGTCSSLDRAGRWSLKPIKNGRSITFVPASLETILEEKTAINVHKSSIETQIYVSCGNITAKP